MGNIYVTGYRAKLFYNYLKQTKFNRPVHLVYWNFQFRKANIIVQISTRFRIWNRKGNPYRE